MEEDINYSSVVFKDGAQPPKEKKEEPTVYAEVTHKAAAATVSNVEAPAAGHSHVRALAVGLVLACVILVASIGTIVYSEFHLDDTIRTADVTFAPTESGSMKCVQLTLDCVCCSEETLCSTSCPVMNEHRANVGGLTAENQQLITNRSVLERETKELSRRTENLNWTLGVILEFNTFPVDEYCPKKECRPCQKGWIVFQDKCYLFYELDYWKTWEESRTHCRSRQSDLVVIDSLQEQEFISNHTKYYYDADHGYWLGLRKVDNKWMWVDGREDALSYWLPEQLADIGLRGLMIPGRNPTASWDPADEMFRNKFICEKKALMRAE